MAHHHTLLTVWVSLVCLSVYLSTYLSVWMDGWMASDLASSWSTLVMPCIAPHWRFRLNNVALFAAPMIMHYLPLSVCIVSLCSRPALFIIYVAIASFFCSYPAWHRVQGSYPPFALRICIGGLVHMHIHACRINARAQSPSHMYS
jgi:hypothetical protein